MPEKFQPNAYDFPTRLIAMALTESDSNYSEFFNKDIEGLTVSLTLNGRELPVRAVLEKIGESLDKLVEARAKELIQESFEDKISYLYEAIDSIKDSIKERLKALDIREQD